MEKIIKITCITLCIGMILYYIWLNLDLYCNVTPPELVIVGNATYESNVNSLNRMIGRFIKFSKVIVAIEAVLVFILAVFKHKNNEIKKRNALIILGILLVLTLVVGYVMFAPIGNVTAE